MCRYGPSIVYCVSVPGSVKESRKDSKPVGSGDGASRVGSGAKAQPSIEIATRSEHHRGMR
jgi:hypothetical protein